MTPEQKQRIEQIKLARKSGVLPWSHLSSPTQINNCAASTVDFLLSLVKSQEAARYMALAQAVWSKFWDDPTSDRWSVEHVANVLRAADASGDAAVGAGLSSPCEADSISAVAHSATSMRSACVEKVKGLAAAHRVHAEKHKGHALGELQKVRAEECEIVATMLESLSIEKPKE